MTKLIALVAIAAGTLAGIEADLAVGAEFEVDAATAEPLLTEGKAKLAEAPLSQTTPPPPPPTKEKNVKVRLLQDSALGKANDVVEVPSGQAKALTADGVADADKAAVAYALTLDQNKPKG